MLGGLLTALSLPCYAQASERVEDEPTAQVRIRVYNYGQVSGQVLSNAMKHTSRVLLQAGVELNWFYCLAPQEQRPSPCDNPPEVNDIVMKVARRKMIRRGAVETNVCALAALLNPESGRGYAVLVYDTAAQIAETEKLPTGLVLGHVAAHEIGHVLLSARGHSRTGIMREVLRRTQWRRAAQDQLLFTAKQGRMIREGILARAGQMERHETEGSSGETRM
jgi:hypothetical protein